MKTLLPVFAAAALLLPASSAFAASRTAPQPAIPATYVNGDWTYFYLIRSAGTPSEARIGRLFFQGREIKGGYGNIVETPLGNFACFIDPDKFPFGWGERGWMVTRVYNKPIWNQWGGFDADFVRSNPDYISQVKYLSLDNLPLPRSAMPPFRYVAATAWADDTVETDVPKVERIYVFGPGTAKIFSAKAAAKPRDVFPAGGNFKGYWVVSVFRANHSANPVYAAPLSDAARSTFPLRAGDAVWLHRAARMLVAPSPTPTP